MWPLLVCPEEHAPLHDCDGRLHCPEGHDWRIEADIPRMVREDSTYADAFGLQWITYRTTQLDSHTGTTISYDRARRCLGDEGWALLHRPERTDVLEVGCGAGRFTEVLLQSRAHVTSVDYTVAVEANQANFPQDDRHRVIQSDLRRLPFAPGQFDLVFCLGVIQHTPCPEESIAKLYEQLRPGGLLVIDHYTYHPSWYTRSAPLVRQALRRLPPEEGLRWTERLVSFFFPLHRRTKHNRAAHLLLSRLSPVWSYYHHYPQLSDEHQYQWSLLDTHDSLTDWYKHRRSCGQIERALRSLGATAIACGPGGNGVEARCRRPAGALAP